MSWGLGFRVVAVVLEGLGFFVGLYIVLRA